MKPDPRTTEARALRLALAAYGGLALLGVAFAALTGSDAILLDGTFNVVSFVIGLVALRVARLQEVERSERFHFGHAHFEPLLNVVRVLMVLGLASFALYGAVVALFHGGVAIAAGPALVYGLVATAACAAAGWRQRAAARRSGSPLLAVDAQTWILNAGVSAATALAFLVAFLLDGTAWEAAVPYVDPALVILLLVTVVWLPLGSLVANVRELLWYAPEPELQRAVEERVQEALSGQPLRALHLRMVRVGRTFYLMAHLVLPEDHRPAGIGELDRVRWRVAQALAELKPRLAVDLMFTADEHWATALDARERSPEGVAPLPAGA